MNKSENYRMVNNFLNVFDSAEKKRAVMRIARVPFNNIFKNL